MKFLSKNAFVALLMSVVVTAATGCAPAEVARPAGERGPDAKGAAPAPAEATDYSPKLVENRLVYEQDKPDTVVHLYMTITRDNVTAEKPMTWAELNRITNATENNDSRKMNVIIQEGTEQGPENGLFGYEESHPNASIKIRGKSTLKAPQKAYKIELFENAGYWLDQRTINLIKHSYDFTRLRNKLSFDYMKMIPHMTSLRTQFVHLHVKDLTAPNANANAAFEDYGLYTQIEQPNKSFLRMHGLDRYGNLYKASNFEFFRYPDKLKTKDDPAFDKAMFETVLESKGWDDHSKLLRMLDDVNDLSKDFDEVFEQHFDRDNFLTWMAVNILMDNIDTNSQNFLLYSPLNSEKWFFLPWDYDGAWGFFESPMQDPGRRSPWMRGIHNYWGSELQNRFFKNPRNVEQLVAKVRELSAIINPEQSRSMIEKYKPIVYSYVSREPDIRYLPGPLADYDKELERIIQLPVENERKFQESLQVPMPFYLDQVRKENGKLVFHWGTSYDLQGDELTYHVQIAKEPSFAHPLYDKKGLKETSLSLDEFGKGRFFWRVTVTDAKGHEMTAFDDYYDEDGNVYHGMREFYID